MALVSDSAVSHGLRRGLVTVAANAAVFESLQEFRWIANEIPTLASPIRLRSGQATVGPPAINFRSLGVLHHRRGPPRVF
jgi:hypothetical protein